MEPIEVDKNRGVKYRDLSKALLLIFVIILIFTIFALLYFLRDRRNNIEKANDVFGNIANMVFQDNIDQLAVRSELLKGATNFKKILEKEPENIQALDSLGYIYYYLGDIDRGSLYLEKADNLDEEIDSGDFGRYNFLSDTYKDVAGKEDLLEKACLRGIESNSSYSDFYIILSGLYEKKGDKEKSLKILDQGIEINSEDIDLLEYTLSRYKEGDSEYIEIIFKILAINPEYDLNLLNNTQ